MGSIYGDLEKIKGGPAYQGAEAKAGETEKKRFNKDNITDLTEPGADGQHNSEFT